MSTLIIIALVLGLIATMILSIAFPSVGAEIMAVGDWICSTVSNSMGIVWVFIPRTITLVFVSISVSVEVVVLGYHFVIWILKKIPSAGIE